jgi:hypothetical protein
VTGVSTSPATVVSGISKSTGSFVTGVSIATTVVRIAGVALTGATGAGQEILVLLRPSIA